jgi:phage terminase large subunit GpA-like protein
MIRLNATKYLRPCERIASSEWLPRHIVMPKGTETSGLPFSLSAFPHVDAVLEAFDNPRIRRISLQWGSRLGKTTTCLSLMAKVAGTNPRNMMFAGPTKDAAARVIGSRLYPILASTAGVKDQLPPEARRSKLHVKLESCQIFIGWSGSETSLADVGAFYGQASEIDKWTTNSSEEADPLKLFINRFKGFPDHKIIFESTPTIKGRSRIEKVMLESNQHRRYVPCPHCGEFQILVKGDANSPGGFRWDRDSNGNSDAETAFLSAYYECKHCEGHIENHHRTIMLRRGVWVPQGCTIDTAGQIHGAALKAGSDSVGFGPLASWYALTETWGNFARVWIQAQKRPRDLQDVVNSYMGETWETKKTKSTPETVGERLVGKLPRGFVPIGSRFITITIDQQAADGGFVKWVALSHGEHEQSWLIDYGAARSLADLWEPIIRKAWTCEDGGLAMTSVLTAIDSGYDTKRTYEFCNAHVGTIACKGSSTDFGLPYKLVTLKDGIIDEQPLFHVNTDYWETDLQCCLDERLPGEKNSLTLCINACHDLDFLTELCNATLGDKIDSRGNLRMLWIKKDEGGANDFRDAIRYGKALGKMWVESQGLPGRVAGNAATAARKQAEEQASGFVRTPHEQSSGGWIRRRGNN